MGEKLRSCTKEAKTGIESNLLQTLFGSLWPIKDAKVLKVTDMYRQSQLKLCRKYIDGTLPTYFRNIDMKKNSDIHIYNTIHRNEYVLARPSSESSRKLLRYNIPTIINIFLQFCRMRCIPNMIMQSVQRLNI